MVLLIGVAYLASQIALQGDTGRHEWKLPTVMVGYGVVNLWHTVDAHRLGTLLQRVAGRPVINNTDCGPVINPGAARAAAMAKAAISCGAHFLVYGYDDTTIDEPLIAALGQVIHRSEP
ncbi:MAG: hypothetical protein ACP5VE_12635 [Chthonomonadales bacterium]